MNVMLFAAGEAQAQACLALVTALKKALERSGRSRFRATLLLAQGTPAWKMWREKRLELPTCARFNVCEIQLPTTSTEWRAAQEDVVIRHHLFQAETVIIAYSPGCTFYEEQVARVVSTSHEMAKPYILLCGRGDLVAEEIWPYVNGPEKILFFPGNPDNQQKALHLAEEILETEDLRHGEPITAKAIV